MKRFFLIACIGIVFPQDASAQSPSVRLQVFPSDRVLEAPHATQQLAVIAHFPNGVTRDVTRLTLFSSSDTAVATVNPAGLVRFRQGGEVAIFCRYQTMQSVRLTYREPKPGFVWPAPTCHNHVDRLMFAKWRLLSLAPSDLCSDRVFLRRAFIDLCGLLPTAREAQQFLSDPRPDRRTRLVDALLERDEYADRWAHHWATMLALPYAYRKPVQGAAYLQWVRGYVAHTGLDELARDIVLGKGVVTNAGPANFYTGGGAPDDWATRISEAFLGMRLQCSQCHLVSRTRWTPDDWHAFAAFFVQAVPRQVDADRGKIELVLLDLKLERLHPDTKKSPTG
ncbi:MAG: DUF1549 domain-containing protein [Planctomycetes bacterium]|nr:DUF1549 domain-containing protein [Planctomycetota bacterium]